MGNDEQISEVIAERWGGRTLEDFQNDALGEPRGTAFDAVRKGGGGRIILMSCVTDSGQIEVIEGIFDLTQAGEKRDWSRYTMMEMVADTVRGAGLGYQALEDAQGKRLAVAFCATHPDSVKFLETLFNLPPLAG